MTLSDISIRRPVFAWMLMAGLLVFGALSYSYMGISQLPDVDFPVVTVRLTWAGAAPDVMESSVADPVENAVMSVDGVQLVQSISQQGQTQVIIQFGLDKDINVALQEVQTKLSQAQRNLPQTVDPPIITKTNPNDQPIIYTAAYSESGSSLRDVVMFVRDHLQDRITTVKGVGDINLGGFVDPQMRIWLDPKKMNQRQISVQDIEAAVNNQHQLVATGYQDNGPQERFVRVRSEFSNAQECNDLVIPARVNSPLWSTVHIGDVAVCQEGTDEIRRISRFNGIQPTVAVGIIKQHGTNAVAIGDAVRARIKSLSQTLPKGMKLDIVSDTTTFIRDSIHELLSALGMAVLLTACVCFFFLGSFSSAFNVFLAIPVSLVGSFIVMRALGLTINSFTLMALSLSIGIVVDDAIMMLENITRHAEEGKQRVLAAIVGAREITPAAVATSLAILAIFAPVVFMSGIVGKFFFQFGIAMSAAIALSLLEALTLTPMRCAQFLTVGKTSFFTRWVSSGMGVLVDSYRWLLTRCLSHRWIVLGLAFIVFGASLFTIGGLRKEFLPPQDQSRFIVNIYTKIGSSIAFTDQVFREAENLYRTRPELKSFYVAIGGFGGGIVNQGVSFVTMKDPGDRPIAAPFKKRPSQQEFMGFLRKELLKLPGVDRVSLLDLSLSGFSAQRGYPIEFVVQGPEWGKLAQLSAEMKSRLNASGLMSDVDSDYNPNMPQVEVVPNRQKAALFGVNVTAIAHTVAAMVGGLKLLPNKYTDETGHREDIQVKLRPENNTDAFDIRNTYVENGYGKVIPLASMVSMEDSSALLTITRYNRERGISVFGNFSPGKSQSDVMDFISKTAKEVLPAGYHIEFSGSSQAFSESFQSLLVALVLGIFVAYMVLATQFNSFLHPAIILLALPFSVTGALISMRLTGTSVNIYSLIGILLLMGIVKKNSILLVEFTNRQRHEGKNVTEALLAACPVRLRPILMTSTATIAGAIPEALASGSGSETIRPMAIAVIGGVMVSTLLTLIVVPCAYSLASRLEGTRHAKMLAEAEAALKNGDEAGAEAIEQPKKRKSA